MVATRETPPRDAGERFPEASSCASRRGYGRTVAKFEKRRAEMSKIVLHVGTHKTGTTTVQDTFALNRELLERVGLIFPKIGRANGQHGLVMDWIKLPEFYHLDVSSKDAWKRLAKEHARSDRTVLISTEELSRGNPNSRVDLRELRDLISDFDEVKVVCCLRNQISFIQSIYLQVVKSSINLNWTNFLESSLTSKTATGLYLDYSDLRSYFETGFSKSEVVFFSYEQSVGASQGIIGRIMAECGLEEHWGALRTLPAGHSNVSPDPLATWAAAHVLGSRPFQPWLVEVARETLDDLGGANKKTTIFTKAEYDRLRSTFLPLNEKFNLGESEGDEDLSISAFPKADNLMFRDALTPAFWVNLSRHLIDRN